MAISQKGFWWGELSLGCAKLISRKRWHFWMLSLISSLVNHTTFSVVYISVSKGITWIMISGNNRCKCCSETWKILPALPTLVMAKATVPCPQEGLLCVWLQAAFSTVHILLYPFVLCWNWKMRLNISHSTALACLGMMFCSLNTALTDLSAALFGQKPCLWL